MTKEKDKLNFSVWGHDKTVKEFLEHHVDVITDSEWFENLVEEKIKKIIKIKIRSKDDG